MKKRMLAATSALMLLATAPLRAADTGDLIFPLDMSLKTRVELIYAHDRRDLDSGKTYKVDRYSLRLHTDIGSYASLDFDLGAISPSGGSTDLHGGIGLSVLAYDRNQMRISPVVRLHYAPEVRTRNETYDDVVEFKAGVLWALLFRVDDQTVIMPYAGPLISTINLSGPDKSRSDRNFGLVAGVSVLLPGQNTFRLETSYIDDFSFSIAAGIAF